MAAPDSMKSDIRKFEEIGTHPTANYLAIAEALSFHQGIGAQRKEARLLHLRDYWARGEASNNERIRLHTSLEPGRACGIATVQIDGVDSAELNNWLWNEHRILTTAIKHDQFEGIRVSPSVYTTHEELDRFSEALAHAAKRGIASN